MTGTPAARARRFNRAMARAAARARGSMARAPGKSNALIISMMSNAVRALSGALPRRLASDRGIQCGGKRCLSADERLPTELEPVALALRYELEPLRTDSQHVGLAIDRHFTLQRFFQLGCH